MHETLIEGVNGVRVREALRNKQCVWSGDAIPEGNHILEFQTKDDSMYVAAPVAITHALDLQQALTAIAQGRTSSDASFGSKEQLVYTPADSRTTPCVACWESLNEGDNGLALQTSNVAVDYVWIHKDCCADVAEAIERLWRHEDAFDMFGEAL